MPLQSYITRHILEKYLDDKLSLVTETTIHYKILQTSTHRECIKNCPTRTILLICSAKTINLVKI